MTKDEEKEEKNLMKIKNFKKKRMNKHLKLNAFKKKHMHYKLYWLGYDITHNSWVINNKLKKCFDISYLKRHFGVYTKVCAVAEMIMTLFI